MARTVKQTKYFAPALMLVFLLVGLSIGGVEAADTLKAGMLEKAAAELGLAQGKVTQGDVQRIEFPLSNQTIFQVKLMEQETGKTHAIVLDEKGAAQNLQDIHLAEQAAHDARLAQLIAQYSELSVEAALTKLDETPHGQISPDLFGHLENMDAAVSLTIAVWLRADHVSTFTRPETGHQPGVVEAGDAPLEPRELSLIKEPEPQEEIESTQDTLAAQVEAHRLVQDKVRMEIDSARRANINHLQSQMFAVQGPLLAYLGAAGFTPAYVSPLSPLVYVELPRIQVLELVLQDYVDTLYAPNINKDAMASAKPTQKADIVDNWFGFDGSGVEVAITEDSRVDWPHTYLNTGTTRVPGDANVDNHATATAGMVASQHSTEQGIAQGPTMFSANGTSYSDANMAAALDWAATTQNVHVMNNSWGGNAYSGSLNDHDRHVDWLVRNSVCTITVAAGNDADDDPINHRVGSPGKGYNVITVGAYSDNNTLAWDDDSIANYSSYNDPDTGCQKPEVAASGSSITSTLMGNVVGGAGSGTSYATPMVSGAAALLMERSSGVTGWPESVKAILMATALHNIEGSSRLSDKDGAGGVDMRAAFRVADEGWWQGNSVVESDFPRQQSFYVYAGQTIRAAIAWDSNPDSGYSTDPLEADLDLRLLDPDGVVVEYSGSASNSSEIVEHTAAMTGNYTIEAIVWSWSGTNFTYLGTAWWPGHRKLSTAIQNYDTPPVSRDYFQFTPHSAHWNVVGIRTPAPTASNNYNIYLYENSAFGDPGEYNWLEDSTLSGVLVDYVVVDRNHAPAMDYFTEVRVLTGSGNYPIQFDNNPSDASDAGGVYTSSGDALDADGTYTYNITDYFLLNVHDTFLSANIRKYFAIKVQSGNADLGMALHNSTVGSTPTYYQGRSNRVVQADSAGAGGDEYMNYQTATSDDMGLVYWNNGAVGDTSFKLYVDSTGPTGSILINGGAATTSSTNVTLTLNAADSQTGLAEMRFSNDGSSWSGWESFNTTKAWTLTTGDGTKTVYVQFMNNAGQPSISYSDTILLSSVDTDNDGVPDASDNCINAPNGPLILDEGGNSQLDTDGDGYGNMCDADLAPLPQGDGFVDFADLTAFQVAFFTADANADFDGSGFVDFSDLTLFQGAFFQAPGPSCCGIPLP